MLPLPASILLAAILAGLPEGALQPTRTATGHAMRYDVSLPVGWTAERTWPVVVVVPDAHREFRQNLDAFVKARGDGRFILVAPHVLTCGGAGVRSDPPYGYSAAVWKEVETIGDFRFDSEGIAAVVKDVKTRFGGEDRYFLTGWEAGGHTVWAMLLQHPDALRGVAPVSTNYKGRWLPAGSFSTSPSRTHLPVKVLFCGAPAGEQAVAREFLLTQTREAIRVAEEHGFEKVTLEIVPGTPHGPLAAEVLAFFSGLVNASASPGPSRSR